MNGSPHADGSADAGSSGPHGAGILRTRLHGIAVTRLTSNDGASAIIADHGAHVLSWCPAGGEEALYLSPASRYGAQDAIRGGVPVIFPQFGEQGPGKRHGIARIRPWSLLSATLQDDAAVASLALQGRLGGQQAQAGQAGGNDEFRLVLELRLHGQALELGLTIENIGEVPWTCQAALHTYLRVDALEQSFVHGLQGCSLLDQVAGGVHATQPETDLDFAREVDRIYTEAPSTLLLSDGQRRIRVAQRGFADTVVWNPGPVKAAALTDLPVAGYREFVCIESAAVGRRLMLEPGACWHGAQHLQVVARH